MTPQNTTTYRGRDTADLLGQAIAQLKVGCVTAIAMIPNDPVWNGTRRDLQNELYRLKDIEDHVKSNGEYLRSQS